MSSTPLDPRDRGVYGAEPIVVRGAPYPVLVRNGAGTAALVFGIIGLLLSPVLVGGVLGLIAVICGFVGFGRVNRREASNRGSAMTGVVLGLVAIAVSISMGVFINSNKDNVTNLTSCLKNANTAAEQTACQNRFRDAVTK